MESLIRNVVVPRGTSLVGVLSPGPASARRPRDEQVDVPEVEASSRVSFSGGIAVQPGFPVRGGADRYRTMERDAEREASRVARMTGKET